MQKIKIHPSFLLLAVYLVVFNKAYVLVNMLATLILHELAHAKAAEMRGYAMRQIVLMPYGAVIYGEENLKSSDVLIIALSGPAFNMLCALALFALWWVAPSLYVYTDMLCYANISLALFNLLPVYPLDGSRVVLALVKNKRKSLRILKILGIAAGVCILGFFVLSLFSDPNITYLISAIFITYSAFIGTEKEALTHISQMVSGLKNIDNGIEKKDIYISGNAKLIKLMTYVNGNTLNTFTVVDSNLKPLYRIEESDLERISLQNSPYMMLKEIKHENSSH